ncbi:hypothetical protein ACFWN1_28695 [Streptomyces sp. NPDC058459]|uniref:hypothetical protein n=1 Tax=Streptomyces sp. NPDC058459 TaxID=3346508 RepID=UPI00366749C2
MHRGSPDGNCRPFTLIACADCQGPGDQRIRDRLRQVARSSPHGVMVATACLDSVLRCRATAGLHAAVQPCTTDRRPSGGAVLVGPIATAADAEAVCSWIETGMRDDGTLPRGLLAQPAPRRNAHLD